MNIENKKDREKLRRLYIAKRTELQMIKDRGFEITDATMIIINKTNIALQDKFSYEWMLNSTFEQFIELRNTYNIFLNRESFSSIYYRKVTNSQGQIFVLPLLVMYLDNPPFDQTGSNNTVNLYTMIATMKYHDIICISQNGISTKELKNIKTSTAGINFWFFEDSDLAFNRTKFALAPIKTVYYPPQTVSQFEKEEELQAKQLPFITKTDMLSKWYGATIGGVFMELIMGTELDKEIFYRTVTNSNK